jgi:fermentation-respiration switch protein FrsA (DUF1100 family)
MSEAEPAGNATVWMNHPAAQFARRALIAVVVVLIAVYLVALALLYIYQRDLLFIGSRFHAVAPPPHSIYRVDTVREADGARLTVWRVPPLRAGQGTVAFFYGNGGTLDDFADIGAVLHAQGYGIVLASYRGYSGNPGHPTQDGVMADARAIIASIPASDGPVVLWGQSLGTGVAARMASEHRSAALILQSPYTSIADVAATRYGMFPVHWLIRDPFDTASVVAQIECPVLIIHGTADRVVPFAMGETLAQRFGRQARFVPIRGGGHNDLSGATLLPIVERWLHDNADVIRARAKAKHV